MKLLQCNYETIEIPEKKWNYDSEIIGIDIPVVAVMGIGQNVQKFIYNCILEVDLLTRAIK